MARTWHRWLPAGAVTALIAGTVVVTSQAGAADLAEKSPEDVLAMLGQHSVEAFSGTFEQRADLGLPARPAGLAGGSGLSGPDGAPSGPAGPSPSPDDGAPATGPGATTPEGAAGAGAVLDLLTGERTGRVFVDGPQQARVQLFDGPAERNVVVNGREVWTYDSAAHAATHVTLPDPADLPDPQSLGDLPAQADQHPVGTPEELAATVLEALEPSTEVSVGQPEAVAGRDAYTLLLAPRAEETLVESVSIAVDGETGFPLGVTVQARGQADPAFHVAYTDLTLEAPDAALFDFTPPAGADVAEYDVPVPDPADRPGTDDAPGDLPPAASRPEVRGEGWASVLVLAAGVDADALADEPLLAELTEPVEGGRLLSTALLSALITDDGRVLLGAVTPEHLQDAAAS